MANSFMFDKSVLKVGDTISLEYKIKDGEKERTQLFKGILLMVKGNTPQTRAITIRKISKIGIGVERIIPLASPNIVSLKIDKPRHRTPFILTMFTGSLLAKLILATSRR